MLSLIRVTFLAAFILAAGSASAAELRITGPELASMLQTAFGGTVIRLHHDGPAKGPGLPPTPGSMIRLGPRLGSQAFAFSIPAKEVSLGVAGRARFSVNDVISSPDFVVRTGAGTAKFGQNIKVVAVPGGYVVTLRFEDQGTEILGEPAGRLSSLRAGIVPDVEVNSTFLQIVLLPANVNGRLAFKLARVIFDADIQASGLANIRVLGYRFDLVNELTDYKTELKRSIEREVAGQISRNLGAVSSSIASEVGRRGSAMGVRIAAVRFEGTTLVVTGTPVLD